MNYQTLFYSDVFGRANSFQFFPTDLFGAYSFYEWALIWLFYILEIV